MMRLALSAAAATYFFFTLWCQPMSAFLMVPTRRSETSRSLIRREMGFMDGLKKAFENDPAYETNKPSAGLASSKKLVDVSICGKRTQAIPGQRMKDLVRAARAPIRFNCENGACGTCESIVNGRRVRVCTYKVPSKGPVEIKLK